MRRHSSSRGSNWPVGIGCMAGAFVVAVAFPAEAQTSSPIEHGRDLAQRLCASCHLVPGDNPSSVTAGIVSLKAIAEKPGQTGEKIKFVLVKPHAPMPDLQLTATEIESILHFLQSLRSDRSAPPLIAPALSDPKPAIEKPS